MTSFERIEHQYSMPSTQMLKKLGLKGDWLKSLDVENISFTDEDGKTKRGKRISFVTIEKRKFNGSGSRRGSRSNTNN